MRIFGLDITRAAVKQQGVPGASLSTAYNTGWWPIIREPFTGAWQRNKELRRETIVAFSTVFSCVSLISSDIGKVRIKLMEEGSDGLWNEVDVPAFSPVLRKPNHYQTRIKFIQQWVISRLLFGNTYVLKGRDSRQVVTELYVLDPNRCRALVTQDGDVYYQLYTDPLAGVSESDVVVPASEVIHDVHTPLFHPLCGVGPMTACGLAASQALAIQHHSANLFANGATPSGVLTAPGEIDDSTASRMKERWQANFSGDNAGRVAVLGNGLKYDSMAMNAVDGQLIEQLRWDSEQIASCFHVPGHMVGIGASPAYNNIEALQQGYYTQCLQEPIESIELCLAEGLGLEAVRGHTYGVEFDLEALLRMDTPTKVRTTVEAIRGTLYSPNEGRAKFDLKPLKGGDQPFLQEQNWPMEMLADRPMPVRPPTPPAPIAPPDGGGGGGGGGDGGGGVDPSQMGLMLRGLLGEWRQEKTRRPFEIRYNPNHEPAGSPSGGQFTEGPGGAAPEAGGHLAPSSVEDVGAAEVHVNPHPSDVAAMLERHHGDLRAICEGKRVAIWPAEAALHQEVQQTLDFSDRVPRFLIASHAGNPSLAFPFKVGRFSVAVWRDNGEMVTPRVMPAPMKVALGVGHEHGIKFDPSEPRVPAGEPGGGQWTDGGGGAAQLSWEAAPGQTTEHLPEYHSASAEQKAEYYHAVRDVLTNSRGQDRIALAMGLPAVGTVTGPGVFEGEVNPGAQAIISVPPGPLDQDTIDRLNMAEATRGRLLRQDAAAWHHPVFSRDLKPDDANLVDVSIGRPLTETEAKQVDRVMRTASGSEFFAPLTTARGFRLMNVPEASGLSNAAFQDAVHRALPALELPDMEARPARAESGYISNDWKAQPNGEGYMEAAARIGRPDLSRAGNTISRTLGPQLAAVEDDFASRYGWTPDETTRFWEEELPLAAGLRLPVVRVFDPSEHPREPAGSPDGGQFTDSGGGGGGGGGAPKLSRTERVAGGGASGIDPYEIYINPKPATVAKMLRDSSEQQLRVVVIGHDVAIADGAKATHSDMVGDISESGHPMASHPDFANPEGDEDKIEEQNWWIEQGEGKLFPIEFAGVHISVYRGAGPVPPERWPAGLKQALGHRKAFDPAEHPREPAGSPDGGQFTDSGGGGGGGGARLAPSEEISGTFRSGEPYAVAVNPKPGAVERMLGDSHQATLRVCVLGKDVAVAVGDDMLHADMLEALKENAHPSVTPANELAVLQGDGSWKINGSRSGDRLGRGKLPHKLGKYTVDVTDPDGISMPVSRWPAGLKQALGQGKAFDPADHPRVPAGDPDGGQFTDAGGGGGGAGGGGGRLAGTERIAGGDESERDPYDIHINPKPATTAKMLRASSENELRVLVIGHDIAVSDAAKATHSDMAIDLYGAGHPIAVKIDPQDVEAMRANWRIESRAVTDEQHAVAFAGMHVGVFRGTDLYAVPRARWPDGLKEALGSTHRTVRVMDATWTVRAFDPAEHPREPAGSPDGGQFTDAGGGGGGGAGAGAGAAEPGPAEAAAADKEAARKARAELRRLENARKKPRAISADAERAIGSWFGGDSDVTPNNMTVIGGGTGPSYEYNCVADAMGDKKRWWWPGDQFWPRGYYHGADSVESFDDLMLKGLHGSETRNEKPEDGFVKLALYADEEDRPQHLAKQLPNGEWTTKFGHYWTVRHPTAHKFGTYGRLMKIYKVPLADWYHARSMT